jgi:hypothetical protein
LQNSQEVKFLISEFNGGITRVGYIQELNPLTQGTSDSQRVGDRVRGHSLKLNLWRVISGSATGRFSLRVLIIHDKQNQITDVSQVFLGTDTAYAPLLQFVKDYRLRFSVLYDSHSNHMDQYNKGDCIHWSAKCGIKTQFLAASDDVVSGSIKLVAISNQQSSGSPPQLIGSIRYNFTDS